jgi:hypothetical protein
MQLRERLGLLGLLIFPIHGNRHRVGLQHTHNALRLCAFTHQLVIAQHRPRLTMRSGDQCSNIGVRKSGHLNSKNLEEE